ncbi:hypothetical protein PSAT104721_09090 [Pseudoalteromonas atlantica]
MAYLLKIVWNIASVFQLFLLFNTNHKLLILSFLNLIS